MKEKKKRYNLVLTKKMFEDLKNEAKLKDISTIELLRIYIRLGLILIKAQEEGGKVLIRDKSGKEPDKEIIFL